MKSILAVTTLFALGLIGALLVFVGAFKPVLITESDWGPVRVVFKHHVGAYHKIVPVMEEVEAWARTSEEKCTLTFGEFQDDPKIVDEDRLNSNVGCLVEKEWLAGLPAGFEYREKPRLHALIAEFDGAPSIGPLKVYPKVKETAVSKNLKIAGPVIETYESLPGQKVKTRYYFPVEKN